MTFLLSGLLVVAAVVLAVIASITSSTIFFASAALASGAAVVLLWRRSVAEKEHIFLTDAPVATEPDWNRNLLRPDDNTEQLQALKPEDSGLAALHFTDEQLGIARYNDLVAAEIMPSLETLSVDQLRAVISREQRGLRRASIVRRAQRLIELTGAQFDVRPESSLASSRGPGRSPQNAKALQKDQGMSL